MKWLAFRRLHAALLLAVSLLSRLASAEEAEFDRCAALDSLENFSIEDREFLHGICEMSDDLAKAFRQRGSADLQRLDGLLAEAVYRGSWEATVILRALRTEVWEQEAPQQSPPANLSEGKNSEAKKQQGTSCEAELGQYLKSYQQTSRVSGVSLDAWLLPAMGKCQPTATTGDSGVYLNHLLLLPKKAKVLVVSAGKSPRVRITNAPESESSAFPLNWMLAKVAYNVPYLIAVFPESEPPESGAARSAPSERDPPYIHHGVASAPKILGKRWLRTDVAKDGCIQLRYKSEQTLLPLLDGLPARLSQQGQLFSGMSWFPLDEGDRSVHLSIVDPNSGSVLIDKDVELDASAATGCVLQSFDFLTGVSKTTIGLLDVQVEDCTGAGIDDTKVRSRVEAILERQGLAVEDLRAWSEASEYFLGVQQLLGELRAQSVGTDRGRLDARSTLATGTAELFRRGFRRLLTANLKCSRGADWEYSFSASTIDLEGLQKKVRDPIAGIDVRGILAREVELVLERRRLGSALELSLARLFGFPAIGWGDFPEQQAFFERLRVEAEVVSPKRETSEEGVLALMSARALRPEEVQSICTPIAAAERLAGKAEFPADLDEGFLTGVGRLLAAKDERQKALLELEHEKAAPLLVRISLHPASKVETTLARSYRCIDVSHRRFEIWAELAGWFPAATPDSERSEGGGTFALLLGTEWAQGHAWFSISAGLGYARTARLGRAPPTWEGVGTSGAYDASGGADYQIQEDAAFVALWLESSRSLCELVPQVGWCSSITRRTSLHARLGILPGLHIINKDEIPEAFVEFRGEDSTDVLPDLGALGDLGMSVQVSELVSFRLRAGLGSARWFDFARSPGEASARRQLLWTTHLGASWNF